MDCDGDQLGDWRQPNPMLSHEFLEDIQRIEKPAIFLDLTYIDHEWDTLSRTVPNLQTHLNRIPRPQNIIFSCLRVFVRAVLLSGL
ncbi:hypothetical protein TNCV_703091 [Trichonephila clavipes]|nr:hypothetical protein TNCV_703091 [Trichonephila clavipes]